MTNRIQASFPVSALRLVVVFGLAAATLAGTVAWPAHADGRDNRGRGRNEARQEHSRQPEHSWQAQRYGDYYRRPDVYYSAPPIVYQPPGYYQQPGASMTFSFPFYR